jgi:hypothetical protein
MKRRPRKNNNHPKNYNNYNDPFGMGMGMDSDDFGFGIHEEFEDPFEGIMGEFGFPNIAQMHQRLFGNIERAFQGMGGQLGDGGKGENYRSNPNRGGLQRAGTNNFQSFFSMQGVGPGTVISKSYCSKVDYRDGQPHQECYQSQSINQIGQDGHKISEKQEAYKNSRTGVQKAAHQRILDDKGMKQIRQRNVNTGTQEEHNIFKGMREDEMDNFNQNYNDYRSKIGFQKNYKYLNALNPYKRGKSQNYLGNGNPRRNPQGNVPQLGDGSNFPQYRKKPKKKHNGNK